METEGRKGKERGGNGYRLVQQSEEMEMREWSSEKRAIAFAETRAEWQVHSRWVMVLMIWLMQQ